ncbi:MAG: hypothetical protein HKN36_08775 [Hellea sp.]|nr:hypothetical protein [Hellea sp.]
MPQTAGTIADKDNWSEANPGTANSRFLKNCRQKYDEANASLRSLGQCDHSQDSDLAEIDSAMQLQADALHYAAKVSSLSGADLLEKFDLWMHDYNHSCKDALPPESLTLMTSIFEDLKRIVENDALVETKEA